MFYSNKELSAQELIAGEHCDMLHTGDSHYDILRAAGGDNYKFNDPRPGKEGQYVYPQNYFVNRNRTKVKGINFKDSSGKFACSYEGKNYDELRDKNHADYEEARQNQFKNTNIKYGTQRERIPASVYDRDFTPKYDTSKLENKLPLGVKGVELKSQKEYPELYDKYQGINNPVTGNQMKCEAVYTNKISPTCQKESVQYVEFSDDNTKERYHYINKYDKSIDKQIGEDLERQQQKTHDNTPTQQNNPNHTYNNDNDRGPHNSGRGY